MTKHRRPNGRHGGPAPKIKTPPADGERELSDEEALAAEVISLTEQRDALQAKLVATEVLLQQRSTEVANLSRLVELNRVQPSARGAALREKYKIPQNFSFNRDEATGRTTLTSPDAQAPRPAEPEKPAKTEKPVEKEPETKTPEGEKPATEAKPAAPQ